MQPSLETLFRQIVAHENVSVHACFQPTHMLVDTLTLRSNCATAKHCRDDGVCQNLSDLTNELEPASALKVFFTRLTKIELPNS